MQCLEEALQQLIISAEIAGAAGAQAMMFQKWKECTFWVRWKKRHESEGATLELIQIKQHKSRRGGLGSQQKLI